MSEVKEAKVKELKGVEDGVMEKAPELSQEQALNVLISAAKLATKRGAFELEETELILKATRVFIK